MTPQRLQAQLSGQSSVAKKVYEVVPIQDAWPHGKIYATLNEITRSTMDMRIFRGCLNSLKESGLVREPMKDFFQKSPIKEKKEMEMQTLAPISTISKPASGAHGQTLSEQKSASDPIDLLSTLSSRLRSLADDLDGAAIAIGDGIAESSKNLEKLKQLQSILKSLS